MAWCLRGIGRIEDMDEIDALIDQALGTVGDAAPAAAEPDVGASPPASGETGAAATAPDPTSGEVPSNQETPPATETPPAPVDASTEPVPPAPTTPLPTIDPATVEALQRDLGATRQQLRDFILSDQQRAERERLAKLRAEWDQLEPAERDKAQAEFVIHEAVKRVQAAEAERDRVLQERER